MWKTVYSFISSLHEECEIMYVVGWNGGELDSPNLPQNEMFVEIMIVRDNKELSFFFDQQGSIIKHI